MNPPNPKDILDADVIVVGAGPAGSAAACDLARRNYRVLLIDRESFPRDKTCGDGVPPGSIGLLNDLGMSDAVRSAGFYSIDGIRIGSPSGINWETSFRAKRDGLQFVVAPRREFDAIIQQAAVDSGAVFLRADVRSVVIRNGTVMGVVVFERGQEKMLRSRVVIGADGATSVVARSLKPRKKLPRNRRAVAIRAYVEGVDTLQNKVEFYFSKRFKPGYGWGFPLGPDRANVGVYMRVDRLRQSSGRLEDLLGDFMRGPALAGRLRPGFSSTQLSSWQLPCGSEYAERNAFDGALLVGDAAGFVDPLTGEGIHSALVSASLAAGVVAEALSAGDVTSQKLSSYDRLCADSLGRVLKRSARVQNWVDCAPWWVDVLFTLANAAPGVFRSFLNRNSTDFIITR